MGEFQSTRPVWGATGISLSFSHTVPYFNPRAPCGARQQSMRPGSQMGDFNPRAPCGARPCTHPARGSCGCYFNPRAPCGARLCRRPRLIQQAPFQSTRPVWGATLQNAVTSPIQVFQSTRPVWGATANLTILPHQICTKGTKKFLLGRKTHGEKGKIKQKLACIHAFSAFLGCEGSGTFCALVLRTQYR